MQFQSRNESLPDQVCTLRTATVSTVHFDAAVVTHRNNKITTLNITLNWMGSHNDLLSIAITANTQTQVSRLSLLLNSSWRPAKQTYIHSFTWVTMIGISVCSSTYVLCIPIYWHTVWRCTKQSIIISISGGNKNIVRWAVIGSMNMFCCSRPLTQNKRPIVFYADDSTQSLDRQTTTNNNISSTLFYMWNSFSLWFES